MLKQMARAAAIRSTCKLLAAQSGVPVRVEGEQAFVKRDEAGLAVEIVIPDPSIVSEEYADAIEGFIDHEVVGHVNCTDGRSRVSFTRKVEHDARASMSAVQASHFVSLFDTHWNFIEDAFIESRARAQFPGIRKNLQVTLSWLNSRNDSEQIDRKNPAQLFALNYVNWVRHVYGDDPLATEMLLKNDPDNLIGKFVEEKFPPGVEAKIAAVSSTMDSLELAKEIADFQWANQESQQDDSQSGDDKDSKDDDGSECSDDQQSSGQSGSSRDDSDESDGDEQSAGSDDDQSDDGNQSKNVGSDSDDDAGSDSDDDGEDDSGDFKLDDSLATITSSVDLSKMMEGRFQSHVEGVYRVKDYSGDIFLPREDGIESSDMVSSCAPQVQRLIPVLRRHVYEVDRQRIITGLPAGKLNSRRLHTLYSGSVNLFKQKIGTKITKSSAVSLVVDMSGSMEITDKNGNARIHYAAYTAHILASVFRAINTPTEISGFTTIGFSSRRGSTFDRNTSLYCPVYLNFDEQYGSRQRDHLYAVSKQKADMNENIDSESIAIAASRLLKRPEKRKIMFVMSDGAPSGMNSFRDEFFMKKTMEEVHESEIILVGVGIDSDYVKQYYKNSMVITDLADLSSQLTTKAIEIFTQK